MERLNQIKKWIIKGFLLSPTIISCYLAFTLGLVFSLRYFLPIHDLWFFLVSVIFIILSFIFLIVYALVYFSSIIQHYPKLVWALFFLNLTLIYPVSLTQSVFILTTKYLLTPLVKIHYQLNKSEYLACKNKHTDNKLFTGCNMFPVHQELRVLYDPSGNYGLPWEKRTQEWRIFSASPELEMYSPGKLIKDGFYYSILNLN